MRWLFLLVLAISCGVKASAEGKAPVEPATRPQVVVSKRPMAPGAALFVDSAKGHDDHDGSQAKPWKTLGHAVIMMKPGDTLYLRGGVYYERLIVSQLGRKESSITLRSFPGETAILDGGFREFLETPVQVWEPVGTDGEYRSTRSYPNIRDVMGSIAASVIGLHTYHHAQDLRAANELMDWEDSSRIKETDVRPVYCGPGLWYDAHSGRVHVRLAHTHIPNIVNYRGETDPRKVPLVIAPFRSAPLLLDGARHVRFQDLLIRGGGYDTVVLRQCADVEFDNVTVFCSTYGMRITGTHRFKLFDSGLYGSVPPWTFRTDTSLRSYPGRPYRDLTRFGTHALLVPEGGREFEVFALPINDDWEIAHCDFTGGHDGVYLGGINLRFHHNRIYDLQDDGIYLSPMYSRVGRGKAEMHLYENVIERALTPLAFGGPEQVTEDSVLIYRNVIELLQPLQTGRPSSKEPEPRFSFGHVMGDHGGPPWSAMKIYHNTFVMHDARRADMGLLSALSAERPRRVFNNILLHVGRLPLLNTPAAGVDAQADSNLYWSPNLPGKQAAAFFAKFRASPAFEKSKASYPPGSMPIPR